MMMMMVMMVVVMLMMTLLLLMLIIIMIMTADRELRDALGARRGRVPQDDPQPQARPKQPCEGNFLETHLTASGVDGHGDKYDGDEDD
jgi:hypothetical protein